MSLIDVSGKCRKRYKQLAKFVAERVIELMGFPDSLQVDIQFVSKKEIQRLNLEFRNINKVTDVLSFPSFQIVAGNILDLNCEDVLSFKLEDDYVHFGDMALCLSQTKKQAKEFDVSVESEIKKLVVHSMLHLMGYDHIKDEDYEIMKKEEERLEKLI